MRLISIRYNMINSYRHWTRTIKDFCYFRLLLKFYGGIIRYVFLKNYSFRAKSCLLSVIPLSPFPTSHKVFVFGYMRCGCAALRVSIQCIATHFSIWKQFYDIVIVDFQIHIHNIFQNLNFIARIYELTYIFCNSILMSYWATRIYMEWTWCQKCTKCTAEVIRKKTFK